MVRMQTFGPAVLTRDDGTEVRSVLAQPKRLALLAYLAIAAPQGFHRRDTLLGLFWPEMDTERARAALSQALYFLRRSLGPDVVVARGPDEVGIDPGALSCDVLLFARHLEEGTPSDLAEALRLYRGDLLPGLFLTEAGSFERWLEEERARLRNRAVSAADELSRLAEADDRLPDAIRWARQALTLAGPDEARLRRLLELLDQSGDRAGALRAFRQAAARFKSDLGLEPSPETLRLVERIKSRAEAGPRWTAPSPARRRAPAPARVASAGAPEGPTPLRPHAWKAGIAVLVLVGCLTAGALLWSRSDAPNGPPVLTPELSAPRLAVLPLQSLDPDPNDRYVADGLTAELISRLSKLRGLRVVPLGAMIDLELPPPLARLGRELGVAMILEGSAQRVEEVVRVTLRLLSSSTAEVVWSATYDASLADMLDVQRRIADDVALRIVLDRGLGLPSLRATRRVDPDAYAEYLQGRGLLGRGEWSAVEQARLRFRQAVSLDSTFTEAWGGLARATVELTRAGLLSGREPWEDARVAALRALRYDDALPEAHAALGEVLAMADWDVRGAKGHFERAIELDPSDASARVSYAILLRNLGQFDVALEQLRQARELDPRRAQPLLEEATVLYLSGRGKETLALLESLTSISEANDRSAPSARAVRGPARFAVPLVAVHFTTALARTEMGDFEAALAALDRADPTDRRPDVWSLRAYIHARSGHPEEARRILVRMDRAAVSAPVSDFHRAVVHVGLGEHERALDLLENAAVQRSRLVHLLGVEPKLAPLRSDPRFQDLLRRIGLADPLPLGAY